ncbi:Hypothetical protein NTJ_12552 [Nesidiocoris tenuis]|uniref:Uncharacterized protein n=1 Tax=Nesidiocoris tenuis TaxID=355587 RepID=A0ABN7B7W4_9HEMI|nr:Hypothetical protein NTJ_12552 [Nesidiocoris tenuis]
MHGSASKETQAKSQTDEPARAMYVQFPSASPTERPFKITNPASEQNSKNRRPREFSTGSFDFRTREKFPMSNEPISDKSCASAIRTLQSPASR